MCQESIPVGSDGMVEVPQGAGLGVHINESTLEQYRVT